jgi:hypothetical protein
MFKEGGRVMFGYGSGYRRLTKRSSSSNSMMVEILEGRQLFAAAGPAPVVEPPVVMTAGFVVEMEQVIAMVKASLAPANAPIFTTQDVFGQWKGTFINFRDYAEAELSVDFNIRHRANTNVKTQAYTGTFDLTKMVGQSGISTVTMSRSNEMRMLVLNATNTVSFNGALSENGKMISGRYTALVNGRYTVGAFELWKQV